MTASDALLRAADDLSAALTKTAPSGEATRRAVDTLMDIFRRAAGRERAATDNRRQHRAKAATGRDPDEDDGVPTQSQRVPCEDDDVPQRVALNADKDSLTDSIE